MMKLLAKFFGNSNETKKLRQIEYILEHRSKGIYKSIDRYREILDLIYKEAPELIARCGWIDGWFKDQDIFLNELADVSQTPKSHYVRFNDESTFPRPYPVIEGSEVFEYPGYKVQEKLKISGNTSCREKLSRIEYVLQKHYRSLGIFKCIDTHREIVEQVYKEAPEFISKNYWVEGWFKDLDDYLNELAQLTPRPEHLSHEHLNHFPRPYPGKPSDAETGRSDAAGRVQD